MHRIAAALLAVALACTPKPATVAVLAMPEHLAERTEAWTTMVMPIIRSVLRDHRMGPKGEWEWTDAEWAALHATRTEAREAIANASAEDQPWLLIKYVGLFGFPGIIGSEWADALLEIPPNHPAWSAPWASGLFDALDESTDQQRFRQYITLVAAEHDSPQIQSGAIYLELEDADRAGDWDRARTLYARLQSPEFRDMNWRWEAETYLNPGRSLRADLHVPEFCAPAIAGPHAGQNVCLDDLFPHERPTLIIGWASWCPPCNEQLPQVIELVRDQPLRVITISYDDDAELAREHLREFGVDGWTILQLTTASRKQRALRGSLDLYPIPFMAFVDTQGLIEAGPPWLDAEALAARID